MAIAREKISYCQVDAHLDTNPKIRKGGRDARDVFEFLLRTIAKLHLEDGRVPLRYIDQDYLADVLMMTPEEACHGVSRGVTVGLIRLDNDAGDVVIVGWSEEWGRKAKTDAERKAEQRARNRADSKVPVTTSHDESRTSHTSHESHESRSEEIRGEEIREDLRAAPATPPLHSKPPRSPKARKVVMPEGWEPSESHRAKCGATGVDCALQFEKFKNWTAANGKTYADWNAAFHTWIGNAPAFARGNQPQQSLKVGRVEAHAPEDYPNGRIEL